MKVKEAEEEVTVLIQCSLLNKADLCSYNALIFFWLLSSLVVLINFVLIKQEEYILKNIDTTFSNNVMMKHVYETLKKRLKSLI